MIKKLIRFFRFFNLRCKPFLACSRHGRCWTHSTDADDVHPAGYAASKEE